MTASVDDSLVAAFVDGELASEEHSRIEAAAAADPVLADRIDRARALRAAIAGAYADSLVDPPPSRLLAAIGGGAEVVDLGEVRARARTARPAPAAARWAAIAASLAVAFFAGRLMAPPQPPATITAGPGGLVAQGVLADSLERQLASNQPAEAPVKIGVSFRSKDGDYCRTFALRQTKPLAGLACHEVGAWRVRIAAQSAPATPQGGYRTAGDEIPAPVLEAMDQTIDGAPLDAPGEAKAQAAGWPPAR